MTHTTRTILSTACWMILVIALWGHLPLANHLIALAAVFAISILEK